MWDNPIIALETPPSEVLVYNHIWPFLKLQSVADVEDVYPSTYRLQSMNPSEAEALFVSEKW